MEYPLGQRLRDLPGPLLLTGHTGFKGTWMTFLLEHLKVPVVGYSLPAEKDSLYDRAERTGAIPEALADIRDYEELERFIHLHKPSTIIHMAAQPLVLKSYESPRETFDVNVMGTVNVLDIAFKRDFVKVIIVVTTDKVYRNDNSGRVFIESDPLEGKDPYSASKVAAEAVIAAWQQVGIANGGPKVISVRAGNVIGGGDFSDNRIIPDLVRGSISKKKVRIRNPESVRPWQHVLDPLVGYLMLLDHIMSGHTLKSLNFGTSQESIEVIDVAKTFKKNLLVDFEIEETSRESIKEAINLKLDSTKAYQVINWRNQFTAIESIELTAKWWNQVLNFNANALDLCRLEIKRYVDIFNQSKVQ